MVEIKWLQRKYSWVERESEGIVKILDDSKLDNRDSAALAGLHKQTVDRLRNGDTINPKHSTLAKILEAHGYKYAVEKVRTPDFAAEIPEAREEYRQYRKWLERKRRKSEKRTKVTKNTRRHSKNMVRRASGGSNARSLHQPR